jgi:molybdate transport system substrate-binding protein
MTIQMRAEEPAKPMFRRRLLAMVGGVLLACGQGATASTADAPIVAAASDLKFALKETAARFRAETGSQLTLTFGSSGNLFTQIRQGAPFQMYLSADEDYVLRLADEGLVEGRGELYAIGRIVLMVPRGSPLRPDGSLDDLAAALADGRLTRLAIANPEHAPYGRRAMEALRHKGLWEAIRPRLVLGENVSQAAQFAVSGSAEGGIVAYSLALSPQLAALGEHAPIPEAWHEPLRQRMALLKGGGQVARRFYAYMQQPAARAVMRRYGFGLPGEAAG